MLFQFPAAIQLGLATGKLVQVVSKSGVPLGLVRDVATGRFAGQAIAVGLDPLSGFPNLIINGWNAYQSGRILDQGRQTLQVVNAIAQSVSVLQATTAVIGVGVAATAALSAVNLYQTLKLRREVSALRLEVKEGFIDLKQALQDQGLDLIRHLDQVAEDVEFRHHRTILARAYGLFTQAIVRLQSALTIEDSSRRNADINSVRDMMFQALADYDNPQLLHHTNAAGYIRRRECVWAIQQAISLTYQVQGEATTVSQRLQTLCTTIRQDSLTAIAYINSQAELDFLFPELVRIQNHDLQAINLWHSQIDWAQTLPPDEINLLNASDLNLLDLGDLEKASTETLPEMPSEQALYEELQPKSNAVTLCDQLRLMVAPDLRLEYATVISQQAQTNGLKGANAQKAAKHIRLYNLQSLPLFSSGAGRVVL